jgi:DNA-binding transcriptional ArsR family regulator
MYAVPINIHIKKIGLSIGDTSRIRMLMYLMSGQSATASQLAGIAKISASTGSEHLAKLVDAKLLKVQKLGRKRLYSIESPMVANLIETVGIVAKSGRTGLRSRKTSGENTQKCAHLCYDHLAGRVGVAIASSMVKNNQIILVEDGGRLTRSGILFLIRLGVYPKSIDSKKGDIFCRSCLDWLVTGRHLSGTVGSKLSNRLFELQWFDRIPNDSALKITMMGRRGLLSFFGIRIPR